jgi:DHA1 family bicyclomycin/chloramphenicol resistance-like MFS transporter
VATALALIPEILLNPTSDAPKRSMGKREFIVLISMLMALTALAIDMMLPAFAQMRSDFGLEADSSTVALVVTVFLIGFGTGQPVWGPLSDALGRKRILWVGLFIYVLGAIGAALAPSLAALLLLRFVSGFGAAAIRVVTQGAIRDRYQGQQMAKVLSYIMAVFLLVPMVAPSLGAGLLAIGDWRWIFGFYVVVAVLVAAWSTRLPETLPPERRIDLNVHQLIAAAKVVLTSRFTMGFTIAQMMVFGFFASYLASTELMVEDIFGLGSWFPVIFGGAALMLGGAILFNPRLLDRFGLRRMVGFALTGYLITTAAFVAIAIATGGRPPFWLYLVGILPILLAHSFVMPNLNAAAMMPMGRVAGTASAIIGSISILGGAAIGAAIDVAYDGSITPFAMAGAVLAGAGFLVYRWADAVWDRDADRELQPDDKTIPAAALPSDAA